MASMTLRMFGHELRTPVNHIIGSSEMLLEDLADADAADRLALQDIHAAGKELLSVINAELAVAADPDEIVPSSVLSTVQSAVARSVERMCVRDLEARCAGRSHTAAEDVRRIIGAATRLAELARSHAAARVA